MTLLIESENGVLQLTPKQFEEQLKQSLSDDKARHLLKGLTYSPTQWTQLNHATFAKWLGQFYATHSFSVTAEDGEAWWLNGLEQPLRHQLGWLAYQMTLHHVTHFEESMLQLDWLPTSGAQHALRHRMILAGGALLGFLYGLVWVLFEGFAWGFVLGEVIGLGGSLLFIGLDQMLNATDEPLMDQRLSWKSSGLVAVVLLGGVILLNPTLYGALVGVVVTGLFMVMWQIGQIRLPRMVARALAREGLATAPIQSLLQMGVTHTILMLDETDQYYFRLPILQFALARDFAHAYQLNLIEPHTERVPYWYVDDLGVICLDAQQRSQVVRVAQLPAQTQALQPYLQLVGLTSHTLTMRFELLLPNHPPLIDTHTISVKVGANTIVGGARLSLSEDAPRQDGRLLVWVEETLSAEFHFGWA